MATTVQRLYDAYEDWEWQRGVTPLSSPRQLLGGVIGYLAVIMLIKTMVKKPLRIPTWITALHNFNLCAGSAIMFVGCAWESLKWTLDVQSTRWLFCLSPAIRPMGPLFFWSYVYYLSKYYEFLDTVILALKGKPLSFLHVSHHALVCPMAYLWVDQAQSLQQIGLLFNTAIHVVMYYYYFLCCFKIYPKWKQFITVGQIIQFTCGFLSLIPTLWLEATSGKPAGQTCKGIGSLVYNSVFNAMLLVLFIKFHIQTYRAKAKRG